MNVRNAAKKSNVSARGGWCLVQCSSRQDQQAEKKIPGRAHVGPRLAYCGKRPVKERFQSSQESILTGNCFIHLSPPSNFSPLRSSPGVHRLVSLEGVKNLDKSLAELGRYFLLRKVTSVHRVKQNFKPSTASMAAAGSKLLRVANILNRVRMLEGSWYFKYRFQKLNSEFWGGSVAKI